MTALGCPQLKASIASNDHAHNSTILMVLPECLHFHLLCHDWIKQVNAVACFTGAQSSSIPEPAAAQKPAPDQQAAFEEYKQVRPPTTCL